MLLTRVESQSRSDLKTEPVSDRLAFLRITSSSKFEQIRANSSKLSNSKSPIEMLSHLSWSLAGPAGPCRPTAAAAERISQTVMAKEPMSYSRDNECILMT